jgi:membrane protein
MGQSARTDHTGGPDQPSTLRCIVAALRENFALLVAGSLAYSAFMSILPLLTLALVVASVFGGQEFMDAAMQFTARYTPASLQELFVQAMQNTGGRAAVSFVSLLVVVWSALRVFRTLDTSFSMFYNTTGVDGIVGKTRDGLLVVGSFGVALVATVGLGVAANFLSGFPLDGLLAPVLLVVPLVLAFLPIYYVFPDTDVTVREVLPGVLVAAIGWAVLQVGFQLYVTYGSQSQVYGTLGAVLLVLTWLYLAGLVLLVGVAVNVVLGDRTTAALAPPPSRTDVTLGK